MEWLENEFSVWDLLWNNLEWWTSLLMKVKPLQKLHAYMNEEIKKILNAEIETNRDVI